MFLHGKYGFMTAAKRHADKHLSTIKSKEMIVYCDEIRLRRFAKIIEMKSIIQSLEQIYKLITVFILTMNIPVLVSLVEIY